MFEWKKEDFNKDLKDLKHGKALAVAILTHWLTFAVLSFVGWIIFSIVVMG